MLRSFALALGLALGISSASFAQNATPTPTVPLGNPGTWVTTNDYPAEALRNGISGTVGFRLTVDASGAVSKCEITASSGSQILDDKTCQLVNQRARFKPATDAEGKPTNSPYSSRVRWVLPGAWQLPVEGRFVSEYVIELDGSVSGCRVVEVSGTSEERMAAFMARQCREMNFAAPFRDELGRPVRRTVRTSVIVDVNPAVP